MSTPNRDRLGRPKKSPLQVRKPRGVRVSALEDIQITTKAESCGLTFSSYLRELGLEHEVTAPAARSADPELVAKLDRLWRSVDDLGNVVNQVALYHHTDRTPKIGWADLPAQIEALKSEITQTIDQVVLKS